MVRPLGFSTHDRWLKRAGLDYWEGVNVSFIDDLEAYLMEESSSFYFFSSKAERLYTSVNYQSDSTLIFGSETAGLPPHLFEKWPDRFVKLPMKAGARCLNLATSAGIAIYEAWRQTGFNH